MKPMGKLATATVLLLAAVALTLGAGTATAGDDDEELVDVSKTVEDIHKKMDELLQKGKTARHGKLRLGAVCGDEKADPVFESWGDFAHYTLAPAGDLEHPEGWTLNKDAAVVGENAPFTKGFRSLRLGDHGEAVSPVICVNVSHPTVRFFLKSTGSEKSRLEIELYYQDLSGHTKKLKIAKLRGGRNWSPSTIVPIYMNMIAAATPDGVTAVAFKFKAKDVKSDEGGWNIDDLYVDPFRGR
jgi:hypothetical protein